MLGGHARARAVDSNAALCEREGVKACPRNPAVWVLRRRRPSATSAAVEAERRRSYAMMDPGERLRRALHLSSLVLRLARRPR